jgi:hypothetical protein
MSDVFVKSGEQPRYFRFGGASGTNTTTSTGASMAIYKESPYSAFQGIVTGTGAVSGTITIQATNEDATAQGTNSNWITIGTITLSGTTSATDGFATIAPWRWVRSNVSAVSGTGATISVIMGV